MITHGGHIQRRNKYLLMFNISLDTYIFSREKTTLINILSHFRKQDAMVKITFSCNYSKDAFTWYKNTKIIEKKNNKFGIAV